MVAHDQIGEAMQGLLRRIGMDRRERSGVAGVEGIEQRSRLDSAHFAEDDPVRSPAESGLQKVVESDVGLERVGLAFDGQNVRLLDLQFRSIFDHDDAFMIRNEIGQYPQKRGLTRTRSAADKQRLSAANLLGQEVCKRARQRTASNEVIDCVMAAGELSNDECWREPNNRRNHRRQAAPIRELRMEYRVVFVEPFAELVGDDFEAGSEFAGGEGNRLFAVNDPVAFVPP